VIFPLAFQFKHPFVRHHTKQGFLIFLLEVASTIILVIPVIGQVVGTTGWFIASILSLIGFINVYRRRYWVLPLSKDLIKYFKFLND